MRTLYLIGGPMGVGKTTVCQIMKRHLPRAAFLDGDWCWDMDPFVVTEETKSMVLGNIRHTLSSFLRCSAFENVIFCWVLHRQDIRDAVLEGLDTGGWRVVHVSLVCAPETLRRRLEEDIRRGLRSPDVIGRALGYLPLYDALEVPRLDTTDLTPAQAAQTLADWSDPIS